MVIGQRWESRMELETAVVIRYRNSDGDGDGDGDGDTFIIRLLTRFAQEMVNAFCFFFLLLFRF